MEAQNAQIRLMEAARYALRNGATRQDCIDLLDGVLQEPEFYDDAVAPPYFWNYEFRFDLRDAPLHKRYEVRSRFGIANLPLDGFSREHVEIVELVLDREAIARQAPVAATMLGP